MGGRTGGEGEEEERWCRGGRDGGREEGLWAAGRAGAVSSDL